MNKLLIATTPTTFIPSPEPVNAFDSLYTSDEIATIKSAYSTGQVFFSLFNEKTRIDNNGNLFINAVDKSYWRWTTVVTQGDGKVSDSLANVNLSRTNITQLRDAAFIAWATDNSSLKTTIKNELIAQSNIALTNLGNTAWVQGRYSDRDLIFSIGIWYSILIAAYLYTESAFSSLEKEDFLNNYITPSVDFLMNEINDAYNSILLGRNVESRTLPPYSLASFSTTDTIFTYKNAAGTQINRTTTLMRRYNNRRNGYMLSTLLMAYIATGKKEYINTCYMCTCESLVYGWFADGSFNEFHRSDAGRTANAGMGYSTLIMSTLVNTAWILWRKNQDTSLFDYTTSLGANGTDGGSKSLLWACKQYSKYFDGTYLRYKYKDTVVADNLFDGKVGAQRIVTDATLLAIPLYNYYNTDTDLLNQITRTGAGYINVSWVSPINQTNYWGGENNAGIFQWPSTVGFASVLLEIYSLNL